MKAYKNTEMCVKLFFSGRGHEMGGGEHKIILSYYMVKGLTKTLTATSSLWILERPRLTILGADEHMTDGIKDGKTDRMVTTSVALEVTKSGTELLVPLCF